MDKKTGINKIREIEKQYTLKSQQQEWLQSNVKRYNLITAILACVAIGCGAFAFSAIGKNAVDIFAILSGVASVASLPLMGYNVHKAKGVKEQIKNIQQEKRELLKDKQHVLDNMDTYSMTSFDITIKTNTQPPKTQTNKTITPAVVSGCEPER